MTVIPNAAPHSPEGEPGDGTELIARIESLGRELARLRQDVDLLQGLERHRDVILSRHTIDSERPLASIARLEASEFLEDGSGFHALEFDASGVPYRWTGPEAEARIFVWIDRRQPLSLRLAFGSFGRSDYITVAVDGQLYPLAKPEAMEPVTIGPLPARRTVGPTEIRLVPSVVFSPAASGSADDRMLGVTLLWLELEAAAA